jgi:glycosyltransferase involved in cell wall biosynthesis
MSTDSGAAGPGIGGCKSVNSVLICAPGSYVGDKGSMGRFLSAVTASLEARGCRTMVLSAKELADAQTHGGLATLLRQLHMPWLLIYWLVAFQVWHRAGKSLIIPISQEYVLPFGFRQQIPIFHDMIQYFYPRNRKSAVFYRYVLPWVSRKLGFVYCVTHATGRMMKRLVGSVNYRVCGVPINGTFLSLPDPSEPGERFDSIWVGTLMRHKSHQRVLDDLAGDANGCGTVAMVVPSLDAPILEREAQARGLGKRVKVFFGLSEQELSSLYQRSATVISTSLLEGFCMPVLEASLCGCVPVVPNRAAFRENFGRFGVLVPLRNAPYGPYVEVARSTRDPRVVATRAQDFHRAVREHWDTSIAEIAHTVQAGLMEANNVPARQIAASAAVNRSAVSSVR